MLNTELSKPLSWLDEDGSRKWDWPRIMEQGHVWIPQDGRVLLLADIETDHLRAILPFAIERLRAWPILEPYPEEMPMIQALRLELAKRGIA
jgi:hypothetical protein